MIDGSTTSLVTAILLVIVAALSLLNLMLTFRALRGGGRSSPKRQLRRLIENNRALAALLKSEDFEARVDESLVAEAMIALAINRRAQALSDMPDERLGEILGRLGYRRDDGYEFDLLTEIRRFFGGETGKVVVEKVAEKLLGIFNKMVGVGG